MEDRVETRTSLQAGSNGELHFRFIGAAKRRQFVVNIQFDASDIDCTERLRSEEYDFMIGKVLELVLQHMRETPNPALH
jgi:hypothetical protein